MLLIGSLLAFAKALSNSNDASAPHLILL